MKAITSSGSIDDAWLEILRQSLVAQDGRLLHAVLEITYPSAPHLGMFTTLNEFLAEQQALACDTVASTIFPADMYDPPAFDYNPDQPPTETARLNTSAADLYDRYRQALPTIRQISPNRSGTYFGRLVSWPGLEGDGYNQLKRRVEQLRDQRRQGRRSSNAADLVLEGAAENALITDASAGLQIYKSTDERTRSFPCLVHIDISVLDGRLSLMALYRNWHLIHKAYGNLIGLTRLQYFLSQQTGYDVGELMVHATVASAQIDQLSRSRVSRTLLNNSAPVPVDLVGRG